MTAQARFRQADLRRVIKAAQDCGCENVRVKIGTDGGIEVIVGGAANDSHPPVEFD